MKPPRFEYHAPTTLQEALTLLDDMGDAAKVLAGGQSLMPMLNMRLARPQHLIDINRLTELAYVRPSPNFTAIGALTRHRALERSSDIASRSPITAEAAALIGDRQIRFRGTIGGSLAHADPAAELPVVALALNAELVLANCSGERTLPIEQFFLGPLMTALEPNDLLVEVRLPTPPHGSGTAFLELARQHGAFAIVSAAVVVTLRDGRVEDVQIALGGAAAVPVRATAAEDYLRGSEPSPPRLHEAGSVAAEATEPSSDSQASATYRRDMTTVYVRKALTLAAERARAAE